MRAGRLQSRPARARAPDVERGVLSTTIWARPRRARKPCGRSPSRGDSTRPRGPYATALDLIQSGLFEKHGFTGVDVAGHPEGNVGLSRAQLFGALRDKSEAARRAGLKLGIVTQFSFDPRPVEHWLAASREEGIDAPVRIGLAGPANPATLLRFALRCGVGNSVAALQNHVGTIGRLLRDTGPDGVVRGLEDALVGDIGAHVECFHFFPFGGLAKTSAWIAQAIKTAEGVSSV